MKILVIGDVFGKSGRRMVTETLPGYINMFKVDFTIANCENIAGGFGMTHETLAEMFKAGVDVATAGNHTWDKKDALDLVVSEKRLIRPANYPATTPGRGYGVYEKSGIKIGVLNLMGRVFMDAIECPFGAADRALEEMKKETNIIIVDMHAEATSEKQAMGFHLDGRVSAVFGTHTHVQTADERVMPRGSAFITDVGMTGPMNSIIGVRPEIIMKRFIQKLPERFQESHGPGQFLGALIEVNPTTGLAKSIKRLQSFEAVE
jgi:hypothetical protein